MEKKERDQVFKGARLKEKNLEPKKLGAKEELSMVSPELLKDRIL